MDQLGKRFLHLVDSLVNLYAFAKGRATGLALSLQVQRSNALTLAAFAEPLLGSIRSRPNPADGPSRNLLTAAKPTSDGDEGGQGP